MQYDNEVGQVRAALHIVEPSVRDAEWGDVRSMLDEYIPSPTDVQLAMLLGVPQSILLNEYCTFKYAHDMGWYYEETD